MQQMICQWMDWWSICNCDNHYCVQLSKLQLWPSTAWFKRKIQTLKTFISDVPTNWSLRHSLQVIFAKRCRYVKLNAFKIQFTFLNLYQCTIRLVWFSHSVSTSIFWIGAKLRSSSQFEMMCFSIRVSEGHQSRVASICRMHEASQIRMSLWSKSYYNIARCSTL